MAQFLKKHLSDASSSWSIGSYGALAEFFWDADEAISDWRPDDFIRVTRRGAIHIQPVSGLVVYEGRSEDQQPRTIAFCLPAAQAVMGQRKVLTELGEDTESLRGEDRQSLLFDLGLDLPHVDACIRSDDPALVSILREHCTKPLLTDDNPALTAILGSHPQRVFRSRLGRIEVYQEIASAAPGGTTPEGPHTHVLPDLLAERRTHSPAMPILEDFYPCLMLYAANHETQYPSHARRWHGSGDRRPFSKPVGPIR